MSGPSTVDHLLARPILDQLPRLLSQVDRNPHSPTWGSCCRNFWHYRIEDISNSQFQEMVLTFALAYRYEQPGNPYFASPRLLEWIDAIARFTCGLQRPSGSFDEVYRGQDSYAATAFVSFCLSETLLQLAGVLPAETVERCVRVLRRAADWILRTEETFAANQTAGAAAALHNLGSLTGEGRYTSEALRLVASLQRVQSREGWFPEYGGADIGYASLTQAYLALLHARTGDERCRDMAFASARFLTHFVHRDGTAGGEYGSRNTEYFIPTGFFLLDGESAECDRLARWLVAGLRAGRHAIVARCLDDRYLAYLSPFYMLAAQFSAGRPLTDYDDALDSLLPPENVYLPECKLWSLRTSQLQLTANLAKGGIFRAQWGERVFIDDGIYGRTRDGRSFTTQHLDGAAEVRVDGSTSTVRGGVFIRNPVGITPWRNIAVRGFNLSVPAVARRRFLDFLRRTAVSAAKRIGWFERSIAVRDGAIEVVERIHVDVPVAHAVLQLAKERSFSFASTGFFQPQELAQYAGPHGFDLEPGRPTVIRRTVRPEGVTYDAGA